MKVFELKKTISGATDTVVHEDMAMILELATEDTNDMNIGDSFTITYREMDEEEYINLPDFQGF